MEDAEKGANSLIQRFDHIDLDSKKLSPEERNEIIIEG
jgi:hypothetical protein